MPSHHVGSLDAWLEGSFTPGSSIGPGVAPGFLAVGRPRGSPLGSTPRTISAGGSKNLHLSLGEALFQGDGDPLTSRQTAASKCTCKERCAASTPFAPLAPALQANAGANEELANPTIPRGRPPSGPRKRKSLLSLQLRSASYLPIGSYTGPDASNCCSSNGWVADMCSASPATVPQQLPTRSSFAAACSALRGHMKAPGKQAARSMDPHMGTSMLAASTSCCAAETPSSVFAYPSTQSSVCQIPDCCGTMYDGSIACSSSGGFISSGSNVLHYRDDNSGATRRFDRRLSSSPRAPEDCLAACSASDLVITTAVADFIASDAAAQTAASTDTIAAKDFVAEEAAPSASVAVTLIHPCRATCAEGSLPATCAEDSLAAAEIAAVCGGDDNGGQWIMATHSDACHTETAPAMVTATETHRQGASVGDLVEAERVVEFGEAVAAFEAIGGSCRRGRQGLKGVTFASLFSTVLVLPQDEHQQQHHQQQQQPAECCLGESAGPGPGAGAQGSGNGATGCGGHSCSPGLEPAAGGGLDIGGGRAMLMHSRSLGVAGMERVAWAGSGDVWGGTNKAGCSKLAQLKRGNWSTGSGGGMGGSTSIKDLLTADIEPAMYEGTVRRGLPRRAGLGRALSQPITHEMLSALLDSGDLEV